MVKHLLFLLTRIKVFQSLTTRRHRELAPSLRVSWVVSLLPPACFLNIELGHIQLQLDACCHLKCPGCFHTLPAPIPTESDYSDHSELQWLFLQAPSPQGTTCSQQHSLRHQNHLTHHSVLSVLPSSEVTSAQESKCHGQRGSLNLALRLLSPQDGSEHDKAKG